MRVVIADDEPVALERLQLALKCLPETELVGAARTGKEALELIRDLRPDTALLDIKMPGLSGIDVAAALNKDDFVPEIIFVTAFEQYAVRAFELHAVHYLLKPVPFELLRDAIRRARARIESRTSDDRFAQLQNMLSMVGNCTAGSAVVERTLWVRDRNGLARLLIESIDRFEAAGDYVIAHVGEETHLLDDSMASLQKLLEGSDFARVHRSAIVRLSHIKALRRRGKSAYAIVLQTGELIPVGPSFAQTVLNALNARPWR